MSLRNLIVTSALMLTAAGLFTCGKNGQPSADAFSFSLPDLATGKTMSLKNYDQKLIIVDFWATWCAPCRQSIPHLNKTYTRFRDRVGLIGISLDKTTSDAEKEKVHDFVKSMDITYPILLGDIPLARRYDISSIPTLLFVDGKGRIIKRHAGFLDAASLQTLITGLLARIEADNA